MRRWRTPLVVLAVLALSLAFAASAFGAPKVVMFETSKGQTPTDFSGWIADIEAEGLEVVDSGADLANIGGADILIVAGARFEGLLTSPYTAAEAATIAEFVANGGCLIVAADHGPFEPYVQEVTQAVGVTLDPGPLDLLVATDISPHPITEGVDEIGYYYSSYVLTGGTSFLRAPSGETLASYVDYGAGCAAVFTDYDFAADFGYLWSGYDNAVLLMNLVRYCAADNYRVSFDLTPQALCMELPVAIKVHPTIWMDTDVDELVYPCANPLTNSYVSMGFDWTIKSNVPWWKRIEATGLAMNEEFESFAMGADGFPDGYETVQLSDSIAAERVKFSVDGVQVANPWWSDILGDVDNHEDTEHIDYEVEINWCDTAGWYNGYVMLCAFQN